MDFEKSYTLSEASKIIMIPKTFKGRRVDRLIKELVNHYIIEPYIGFDYRKHNSYQLTNFIKREYPEIKNYFTERWTDDGWYQLRMTEYGVQNILNFMSIMDCEEEEKWR